MTSEIELEDSSNEINDFNMVVLVMTKDILIFNNYIVISQQFGINQYRK